ncbi:hypothetical protein BCD67_13100 [Oscillatoriales cyanobacterium USR001]|nr:hypothetical protein BCD67_13100 [Oscillatoriales cyanobacterium USR001]
MSLLTRLGVLATVASFLSIFAEIASSQPSPQNWNLAGTWKLSVGYFDLSSNGSCTVKIPTGASGSVIEAPKLFTKTGSGYSVSVNVPAEIKVSGNRAMFVEQIKYGTLKWEGTLSNKVDLDRGRVVTEFSGKETCNGQATLPFTFKKENKPVYNYIYINGINTPRGNSNDFRGSCLSERRMVQQVLIDRTRLWDETNKLIDTDCNLSGFDGTEPLRKITTWNAQGVPLSVSDLVQSFLQTQGSRNPRVESDRLSGKIVSQMREIMKKENNSQNNEQNYFIIVAHSQGNFFAEKIGGEVASSNSEIDQKLVKRLRIIAIASPTDYTYSLNTNSGSTRVKVQHFTRCDDIVLFLPLLKIPIPGIQSARPFPGNLRPPLRRDGQCVVPNLLTSNDPLLGDNVRAHFLDEYFNSLPIVQVITDRLVAEKKNLLYED